MRNIVFCRDPAGDAQVTVDDTPLNWAASLDVYSHSPSGPEWGYAGSGPAQCALAVLMLFTDTDTAPTALPTIQTRLARTNAARRSHHPRPKNPGMARRPQQTR